MEDYFYSPTISRTRIKPVENSHSTTELVVSLHVNHEERVLRELADTGASSSIILEAYTLARAFTWDYEVYSSTLQLLP